MYCAYSYESYLTLSSSTFCSLLWKFASSLRIMILCETLVELWCWGGGRVLNSRFTHLLLLILRFSPTPQTYLTSPLCFCFFSSFQVRYSADSMLSYLRSIDKEPDELVAFSERVLDVFEDHQKQDRYN